MHESGTPPPCSHDQHSAEILLLHEQIEGQKADIAKWKAEAEGRTSEVVSKKWQRSVDEAVGRERDKYGGLLEGLAQENEMLKANQK